VNACPDIPTEFRMDVSGLMLNQSLRANELPIDKTKLNCSRWQ